MPNLLFISKIGDAEPWRRELCALMPELTVRQWPEQAEPRDRVHYALVWQPEPGLLATFPNLRGILSLGAGVEHFIHDIALPRHVPVARLVDADMTARMTEYVVMHVLMCHRRQHEYAVQQHRRIWRPLTTPAAGHRRVGVMGLGELGLACAKALRSLGFEVFGWSRRPKSENGIATFDGPAGLRPFLRECEILVCLLPLTPETQGIIDRELISFLPKGACLINAARGDHVIDDDLLAAIEDGHIAHAALDVFAEEPLIPAHPFWTNPRITVTPHIAAVTDPHATAASIVEDIHRMERGEPPRHPVDPARGY